MEKGFNKANLIENATWLIKSLKDDEVKKRPCVFLSHKREDKQACVIIASYLKDAGIDYYLDVEDDALQSASSSGDAIKITESIKAGIKASTHMMVVVSDKTYKSLWVPFEVGYGHASILDQEKLKFKIDRIKLSVLTLKDVAEKTLPDYLQVGYIIKGTKSLNDYIAKITSKTESSLIYEHKISSNSESNHRLDNVLNWQL
ncbi:histidyl-tRNA synthetase [Flavobacterium nitrogenifigens]|uniref:Histidyl-tRNA synthetase n=2 Tax=Flavobacterium TaxID=237 RepID=A0A7W7N8T7_9FLAO|nr:MULTISPECIES: toll/interleukin-1 receptor domain-containing protein [Flavobacterium]MBB4804183.1 histidyl-tRNA synthetase [Flavobacterium nitrogenifigens]MBB6389142.1 histidyl-tRNA synthetase [Flavobacterium notoginsengisoli]